MQRKCYSAIYFFFCLFSCLSCDYELEGEHFKKIDPTPPTGLHLRLEGDKEALNIRGIVTLRFSTAVTDREVYGYELLIGERSYSYAKGFPHEVSFDSRSFSNAIHKLRLIVHYRSNTNSLADKLGAESYSMEYAWIIHIDNTSVHSYDLSKIKIYQDGGQLRIDWPVYDHLNFSKYTILKKTTSATGSWYEHRWFEFSNSEISSWIDESFIGKPTTYTFHLVSKDNEAVSREFVIAAEPSAVLASVVHTNGTNVRVKWNSCAYYNNFSSYSLTCGSFIRPGYKYETTGVSDTTYQAPDLIFGAPNVFRLEAISKNGDGLANNIVSEQELNLGTLLPFSLYKTLYVPGNHSFYLLDYDTKTLKRFKADTYQEVASANVPLGTQTYAVSPDGSSLFYLKGNVLVKCNPQNLQPLAEIPIADLIGRDNYPEQLAVYQNMVSFNYKWGKSITHDSVYLVDVAAKVLLDKKYLYSRIQSLEFSPEGQSIAVRYGTWANAFVTSNRVLGDGIHIEWAYAYLHDGSGRIVTYNWRDVTLDIVQPSDFRSKQQIPVSRPLNGGFVLDPLTNHIGYVVQSTDHSPHLYEVFSLSEQKVIRSIPVAEPEMKLMNNALTTWRNNYILTLE